MKPGPQPPPIQTNLFRPGMRIAVACSGGADSVALLRVLLEKRGEFGLVLSVAHMNHGIRGAEADGDQAFVEALANQFGLPFHLGRVDTPAFAHERSQGLEESARGLRYAWFWQLLAEDRADTVVTAHTLDDQAETVLHRLIRGAWTEGLAGIFPVLEPESEKFARIHLPASLPKFPAASRPFPAIFRPLLDTTRSEIESWLRVIGQPWREDSTNRDTAYTRNRIRHELLPALAGYNPGIKNQLAQLAAIARDEEAYWQAELARLLPSLLLPGKAIRGGGRATDTVHGAESLAVEVERLRILPAALRRRVLRAAANQLGVSLNFADTERLLNLCGLAEAGGGVSGRSATKLQIEKGLRAERTPRELRLFRVAPMEDEPGADGAQNAAAEYTLPIPGSVDAPAFGLRLQAAIGTPLETALAPAVLRASRPGDRVALRYSRSRLKIKEALSRARLPVGPVSPVVEWQGEIVWVAGLAIESETAQSVVLTITSTPLTPAF